MRRVISATVIVFGVLGLGCRTTPPPRRVPVPESDRRASLREYDEMKPLPPPRIDPNPLPFDDRPLVSQRPPEQRAFVDAYARVGRPRIAIFVDAARSSNHYDEVDASSIDYEAVGTIMRDWVRSNGQVTVVAADPAARQTADADVLITVRAEPSRQTIGPISVRMIAEAVNARGGQLIGSAVVDVPPPLDKPQINEYTRFLARKLMDQMTETWLSPMPSTQPH